MSIFAVIVRRSVARENVNGDDDDHLIILPSLSLAAA
jgi:hypothetical protein